MAHDASNWQAIKAVLWSFFGVRRRRDQTVDFTQLKPAQVIIAGLLAGVALVLMLVGVVRLMTG